MSNVTPDFILNVKHNPSTILVHHTTINNQLISRLTGVCLNSEYWHKFMVENADHVTRDVVLKTIIDFLYPIEFFPVCYFKMKQTFFLARNCLEAILKLINNKLTVPNPTDPKKPFKLTILVNLVPGPQIKIDFLQPERLHFILLRRYDAQQKLLNLSKFHADPDVTEFCVLCQPKLMTYILQYVVELSPLPIKINLSHNFLRNIEPLKILADLPIRLIDLRNNELAKIENLSPLKELKSLAILKLDGNPLCSKISSGIYVSRLKQICPKLEKVDDVFMFYPNGFFMEKKNFLCRLVGGDVVEQFIEHFFTVYDFEDRTKIADLYHENAMFSLNSYIVANQNTSNKINLEHYFEISRNLHCPGFSLANCDQFLYQGVDKIMKLFKELPRTIHDPLQFQCDLISYTENQAILVVNGVFQEGKCKLGFNRSFVLQHQGENIYKIVNEQLHVYNALNCQVRNFQRHPQTVELTHKPYPFYNRQFWELREVVRNATTLNYDYSQRFLEVYNFDLKSVLTNFLKLYQNNEIPPEAFIEPRKEPMLDPNSKKKPPLFKDVIEKTESKYGLCTLGIAWNTLNEQRLLVNMKVIDPIDKMREVLKKPPCIEETCTNENGTAPDVQPQDIVTIEDSDDEEPPEPETVPVSNATVPSDVPGPSEAKMGAPATPRKKPNFTRRRKRVKSRFKKINNVVPSLFPRGLINFGTSFQAAASIQTPTVTVNTAPITVLPVQPVPTLPGNLINLSGKTQNKQVAPQQHINVIKNQYNLGRY